MTLDISFYLNSMHTRLKGITTQLAEATLLFSPFNDEFDVGIDFSDAYFSKLKSHKRDVDGVIRDIIQENSAIEYFEKYFEERVIPILNPHTGMDWPQEIYDAINISEELNIQKKRFFKDLFESNQIGKFLAQTFMYCLSTDNKKIPSSEITSSSSERQLLQINNKLDFIQSNLSTKTMSYASALSVDLNDKYTVCLTAKDPKHAFRIHITVSKESLPQELSDFKALLSHLTFSGKALGLQVCSLDVTNSDGRLIKHVENSLFVGETYSLPVMYAMKYDESIMAECPGKVVIKADGNTIPLILRNEYDEVILPKYTYSIEREIRGDMVVATFYTEEDAHLRLSLVFTVPKHPKGDFKSDVKVNISVKDEHAVLDKIQYHTLLCKMHSSKILTFYKVTENDYNTFIATNGFANDNKDLLEDCNKLLDFFKKVHQLELHYNTTFDVSTVTTGDAYYTETLYALMTKGIATVKNQVVNTNCEQEEVKRMRQLLKSHSPLKHTTTLDYVTLFNQTISFHDLYNMTWISSKIEFKSKSLRIEAETAILYEIGRFSEEAINQMLQYP